MFGVSPGELMEGSFEILAVLATLLNRHAAAVWVSSM